MANDHDSLITGSCFPDLAVADHESKPRRLGLTCILDGGLPLGEFSDYLRDFAAHIDFVKFGWGTALVTPSIHRKIQLLDELGVPFWFGGTLFECAYTQGKAHEYVDWVASIGCDYIEISDGSIDIPEDEKLEWIADLARRFSVLSEAGSKDATEVKTPSQWTKQISTELTAGAWKVIAEGRESGTAGIYRSSGEVRSGLIKELDQEGIDFGRIVFEAPQKQQQVWFIQQFGPNVNLGNISVRDVVPLETLRRGLRSDTIALLPR